eukprot:COSAG01_NODE_37255_length_506_cov_0.754300_1_plen_150_part_01
MRWKNTDPRQRTLARSCVGWPRARRRCGRRMVRERRCRRIRMLQRGINMLQSYSCNASRSSKWDNIPSIPHKVAYYAVIHCPREFPSFQHTVPSFPGSSEPSWTIPAGHSMACDPYTPSTAGDFPPTNVHPFCRALVTLLENPGPSDPCV